MAKDAAIDWCRPPKIAHVVLIHRRLEWHRRHLWRWRYFSKYRMSGSRSWSALHNCRLQIRKLPLAKPLHSSPPWSFDVIHAIRTLFGAGAGISCTWLGAWLPAAFSSIIQDRDGNGYPGIPGNKLPEIPVTYEKNCKIKYIQIVLLNDYRFDDFRFYNRLPVSKFNNR